MKLFFNPHPTLFIFEPQLGHAISLCSFPQTILGIIVDVHYYINYSKQSI
jgi:hypothetical protein